MKICPGCGYNADDNATFCPECGQSLKEEAKQEETAAQEETVQAEEVKQEEPKKEDKIQQALDTEDCTAEFTKEDIANNKVFAILAYFGILVLIPILCAKESKYAKFHANQGLVLLIADLIFYIPFYILTFIPVVSVIGYIGEFVFVVFFFILFIIGLINACQDKAKRLPVIGKINLLK